MATKWKLSILLAGFVLLLRLSTSHQSPFAQYFSSSILRLAKAAQIKAYIDLKSNPCDDFYKYACGRWPKLHRTSTNMPKTAYLDQLEDLYVRKSVDMLQTGRELDNSADRKLTQFFESCHNKAQIENVGVVPILKLMDFKGGWPEITAPSWYENVYDWLELIANLRRRLGVNILIGLEVVEDFEEKDMNRLKVGAPKLSLGTMKMYLDDRYDDERDDYKEEIANKLHKNFPNMSEKWAEEVAQQVLDIEQRLAKGLTEEDKLTLPQMTRQRFVSELKTAYGNYVDLNRYLTLVLNQTIYSKVYETPDEYIPNLVEVIRDTPKLHLANYTMWRVLDHLDFGGMVNDADNGNWCVRKIISYFPTQMQSMFNRNYNSVTMVNELQSTWADIKNIFNNILVSRKYPWMTSNITKHAIQKLHKIRLKLISYEDIELADKLRDLNINNGQYYNNLINILEWKTQHNLQTLFSLPQPEQLHPSLPRYNVINNIIEIPVTFLQTRFFWDSEYPHALRYATIGFLLAHEMLRAFDATGRRYDQYGQKRTWWDEHSMFTYDNSAKCFTSNSYNNFMYRYQKIVSADMEEESILTTGALSIAYEAYITWKKNVGDNQIILHKETLPLVGYSADQLFFIGFAQLWCADYHYSVNEFKEMPEELRVNGALIHNGDFKINMNCENTRMSQQMPCTLFNF